jgi:hypothetical protein
MRARWIPDYGLALGVVAGLAGLFANSMTDYPLRANPVMALLMLEVGAVLAYARLAGPANEREAWADGPRVTSGSTRRGMAD